MKTRLGLVVCLLGLWVAMPAGADVVLVEDGVSRMPVVVFENAPPYTRQAADELAEYIEKTSGARPEVIEGRPDPLPESAVWVGYQPVLDELFPGLDFDFQRPEEILVAANDKHLVIAGRDIWDPDRLVVDGGTWLTGAQRDRIVGKQREYGTANAVYTFLQDYLGVRWLWPGELGEDILEQKTISFAPFEHRHHPLFLQRAAFYRSVLGMRHGRSHEWTRLQRLQLHSLELPGGHPFDKWWDRFHETHPEFFALQPDGTRSGYPDPRTAKLCMSNPGVWRQWLADVEQQLEEDPFRTAFGAAENDGHSSGICVCEHCRAWDHPDGEPWSYMWEGVSQEYVAMTDRYITFWTHLARLLKERYPDDNYYVVVSGYGPAGPDPVQAKLPDNTIAGGPGHFPFTTETERQSQKARWAEIKEWRKTLRYRPNWWWWGGGHWGLPEIAMQNLAEDLSWVADQGAIGLFVDTAWEHFATQGPQYYLLAQLTWDPHLDAEATLADYYERGFGDAAEEIEAYWSMLEEATHSFLNHPNYTRRVQDQIDRLFPEVYSEDFLRRAGKLLDQAAAKVADGPEVYAKRVAFMRAGYDYTRLLIENIPLMRRVRRSNGQDAQAVRQVAANWEAIERIEEEAGPYSVNVSLARGRITGGYRGGVHDYFGPPSEEYLEAAEQAVREGTDRVVSAEREEEPPETPATADAAPPQAEDFVFVPAEEAGWELVFEDDFDRDEVGDGWITVSGNWETADGHLAGSGTIVTAEGFPGFQRLEFEASSDVKTIDLFGGERPAQATVSDMSSFIHSRLEEGVSATRPGYFFQFGGFLNTRNRIRRAGTDIWDDEDADIRIVPDKTHHVVVENDEGRVRFIVDGELVAQCDEDASVVGSGFDRVGFYFYTRMKVRNVKLYVKHLMDDLI